MGIWLDVSDHVILQLLRFGYIGDSEDGYIDDLRIRVDWYDKRTGYWFIKLVGYCTRLLWHRLILDDCIGIIGWWISYYCILVQMDEILISSDETIHWAVSGLAIVFILLKVTEKILSDCNTCIVLLFHHLYSNIVHIVIVTSLILLLSPYRPSNRNNMDIDCFK